MAKIKKVSQMDVLRNDMVKMFNQVMVDRRMCPQANEVGNLGGKIMNSCKIQIEYAAKKGEKPEIDFLEPTIEVETE